MHYAVVCTTRNAVIVKGVKNPKEYRFMPNALLNPSLTAVNNTPTEHWQICNGSLVPASKLDRKFRSFLLSKLGNDSYPRRIIWYPLINITAWQNRLYTVLFFIIGAIVGFYVQHS